MNSARRWIGEAAHSLALARGLRSRGHEVLLAVRRGSELDEKARAEAEKSGLHVLRLVLGSRFNPRVDAADLVRMRHRLIDGGFDIIHCHRGKDHWLGEIARLLISRDRRPILVRSRHVVTPVRRHLFNRWLYGRPDFGVMAVSRATCGSLGDLIGRLEPRRVRVILAAVDTEEFHPSRRDDAVRNFLGIPPGDMLVGLIGRIQRIKGQRQFLQAAARIQKSSPRPVHFLLAGRGSLGHRRALVEYGLKQGLDRGCLHVEGFFENLPPVLASLDVGVVASLGSEGSSRVALEYMASAVAVVATRVGGIPDLIDPDESGLLVEPGDVESLAEAVLGLLQDAGRRRYLAEAARRAAEARFTIDRWLQETEDFYQSLLSKRHGE